MVTFQEIRAYKAVVDKLEQHSHVVILGRPGDGKTTLGYQALHVMQEKHNNNPIIPNDDSSCSCSKDLKFLPNLQEGQTETIFLDDLFGIYKATDISMPRKLVNQILAVLRKGSLLVMSMRKGIYLQIKSRLPRELFSNDVIVDLTEPQFQLLDKEKRSMLESALDLDENTMNTIIHHTRFSKEQIGFPQCVAMMKRSDESNFKTILEKPITYIKEQIIGLYDNCREIFYPLLLAFANQGILCSDNLENNLEKLRHNFPGGSKNAMLSSEHIMHTTKTLVGTYFTHDKRNDRYAVSHESFMEGIALSVWENIDIFREYFIKYCPERFLPQFSSDQSDTFFLPLKYYPILFKRLCCLIESRYIQSHETVTQMELWNDPCIVEKFVHHIKEQNCDMLGTTKSGGTILHHACFEGTLSLAKQLAESYPALLNMRNNEGQTPLHEAGWSDSVELVDYLAHQQECDVLDKDSDGWTILHHACQEGKLTLVKHLVENYRSLHTMRDNERLTPLHIAGVSGSGELVDYLAHQQECDVLDKDSDGRTILHHACNGGKLTLVKHLVENYPTLLTMKDYKGLTPLHTAGWSGFEELVDYLIHQQQCDVLDKDSDGRTILHIACQVGKVTVVKQLVENYPSLLTMRDNQGLTPLHTAGWSDSVDLVDYLFN